MPRPIVRSASARSRIISVNAWSVIHRKAQAPDAFLSSVYDEVPELTIGSLADARRNPTVSRGSAPEFIDILGNHKLVQLAGEETPSQRGLRTAILRF
jgi:hypothetical protein